MFVDNASTEGFVQIQALPLAARFMDNLILMAGVGMMLCGLALLILLAVYPYQNKPTTSSIIRIELNRPAFGRVGIPTSYGPPRRFDA